MATETRLVQAASLIYLPGGSHPFRPGDVLPLSAETIADLQPGGHVTDMAPAAEPPPAA